MALLPVQRAVIREIQRLHARRAPLNISAVKRSHPKLIKRACAVRPFWGWKRALQDAGLDYAKINVELRDHVDCKICGRDFGTLDVHLLRKHDVTAENYRSEYPDAKTTCETIRAALARRREHKRVPLPRWEEIWTPEYVLDRMAEMHRRNFPLNIYWSSNHDPTLPGKARQYFGSWDEALRRIGLDPEQIRLARPTEHLTAEQLIARLKKCHADRLREKDDSALANAARKYFGSWTAALRATGIEPETEKSHWPKANKAAILAEIRRRKRAGESLQYWKVGREKWGRALQNRVATLFGSWTAARVAAGFKPPVNAASPWTKANKAAVLAEIRRRKRAGESLQTRKVERGKWGHPFMKRAKKLFGSWGVALLAAGVEPPPGMMSPWARGEKAVIVAEIRRRKRTHQSLHYSEVNRERWGSPLLGRAETLFGSWTAALISAGVAPPRGAFSPWPRADAGAVLAEIRRRKRAGEALRYGQIQREQWGLPLLRRGAELFGSWNVALRAAGIEPVKENSPWPKAGKAAIVGEIRRRQRAGQSLRSGKIQKEKWGKPLLRRAKALFGSWNHALAAAGIHLADRRRQNASNRARRIHASL